MEQSHRVNSAAELAAMERTLDELSAKRSPLAKAMILLRNLSPDRFPETPGAGDNGPIHPCLVVISPLQPAGPGTPILPPACGENNSIRPDDQHMGRGR